VVSSWRRSSDKTEALENLTHTRVGGLEIYLHVTSLQKRKQTNKCTLFSPALARMA
jgi:hypothetical protein